MSIKNLKLVVGTLASYSYPTFNPIIMTVIDAMHNLYLGTVKTVLSLYQKLNIITDSDLIAG